VADAYGCLAWSGYVPCPEGFCGGVTSCGNCKNGCGAPGQTKCAAGAFATCVADANGCLAWSAPAPCREGFCADAVSYGKCVNACPAPGAVERAAAMVHVCEADVNGCLAWSPPAACAAPANGKPVCAGSACGASCNAGYGDCDGAPGNGCETNLSVDGLHCGKCNAPYAPAHACSGGVCVAVAGGHLWSKALGAEGSVRLAEDAAGRVLVVGPFAGELDLGGGALKSAGANDVYAAKLAPDGTHQWSDRFGDALDQVATAVATTPGDEVSF
jgi:hypothetical protein